MGFKFGYHILSESETFDLYQVPGKTLSRRSRDFPQVVWCHGIRILGYNLNLSYIYAYFQMNYLTTEINSGKKQITSSPTSLWWFLQTPAGESRRK